MTSRVNQGAILVAAEPVSRPRLNQAAILVAITLAPDTSPSQINQGGIELAVRVLGRRVTATTG